MPTFPIFYRGNILFAPGGQLAMDPNCCCSECCTDIDDHTGAIHLVVKFYTILNPPPAGPPSETASVSMSWNNSIQKWKSIIPYTDLNGNVHVYYIWCTLSATSPPTPIVTLRDEVTLSGGGGTTYTDFPPSTTYPNSCNPLDYKFDMGFYMEGFATK